MRIKYGQLTAVLSIAALLLIGAAATAATKPRTGITVSPAFQRAVLLGTEAETPIDFTITNNEPLPQTIHLSAADFSSLDESGGLLFVGTNPTALQKKYGLAKWLQLPQESITIAPKQTTVIKAAIINRDDLTPGGHYGALMLTLTPLDRAKNGSLKASLNPIASSLVFANKIGGDIHRLKMTDVYVHRRLLSTPSTVTTRFYNEGNIDLTPRGSVVLADEHGQIISKGIINENSSLILPETYRRYPTDMLKVSPAALVKSYKLIINYRFDGYSGFRTYQSSLLVVSPLGWLVFSLIIGGGAWGIFELWKLPSVKSEVKAFARLWQRLKKG